MATVRAEASDPSPPRVHTIRAEPLTSQGFRRFGQVIGADDVRIELRADEVFHLDIISRDAQPLTIGELNRHHNATQALVALNAKPTVVVVAPPEIRLRSADDLSELRAFICDGSTGINIALGVWHAGPFPVGAHVDMVNVQGKKVLENDTEVAYVQRDLGIVVEVLL
jgi:ureidoglycolate hydrolase